MTEIEPKEEETKFTVNKLSNSKVEIILNDYQRVYVGKSTDTQNAFDSFTPTKDTTYYEINTDKGIYFCIDKPCICWLIENQKRFRNTLLVWELPGLQVPI